MQLRIFPTVNTPWLNSLNRLDTVPACNGQTDRRTTYDSNTALCIASRGNKVHGQQ